MNLDKLKVWLNSQSAYPTPGLESVVTDVRELVEELESSFSPADILTQIESNLDAVDQWAGHLDRQLHYQTRAEVLIEMLEVKNCGSIGGFDKGQKTPHGNPTAKLEQRFRWLRGDREDLAK